MKKNLFKTLFIAAGATVALSSCLGDTESKSSAANAFAYISGSGTNKIAISNFAQMTTSELQSSYLENGDCTIIGYQISHNNATGNIYNANYIHFPEDSQENQNRLIFRVRDQIPTPIRSTEVDTATVNKDLFFTSFPSQMSYQSGSLLTMNFPEYGYRWYIEYKCEKKESELTKLALYYDANKQVDAAGEPLPAGEVVIDFKIERQGSGTPSETEKTVTPTAYNVINFTNMKNLLSGKAKNKVVQIRFRYFVKKLNAKEGEVPYRLYTTGGPITFIDYSLDK